MTASSLTLLAPAKLNLFLHITGRRSDGYHDLQTVFQLLDYGDTMQFALDPRADLSLIIDSGSLRQRVPLTNNLVLLAARRLRELAAKPLPGVAITLTKRIPAGAGLGGGSSDAAITLLALNHLWNLELNQAQLCQIGVELGADVPIFIQGKSAWAEGIGEDITPMELAPSWYLVITPTCAVSTADIFCHEDLTRNTPAIKMADFLKGGVRNDCEAVTCSLFPEVAEALEWLRRFAKASMTGTGSSVFAAFADAEAASAVLQELPSKWQGFVAKGMNERARGADGI